ncbi:arylamine N-acetyltransferase [Iodobacter arcticus]|uniref:Arylamine N-acetyltransferase n=1 Tax=Iodobacter arcticus TaxID=590593 RepID=A0ABW2R0N3_9NEIS
MQRRHVESIAFGNVDLLLGNTPKLNHDALVEKLLVQGRPGYCYKIKYITPDDAGFGAVYFT